MYGYKESKKERKLAYRNTFEHGSMWVHTHAYGRRWEHMEHTGATNGGIWVYL